MDFSIEQLNRIQSAIAYALVMGILSVDHGSMKQVYHWPHTSLVYISGNIFIPLEWHEVDGVWLSQAGQRILADV